MKVKIKIIRSKIIRTQMHFSSFCPNARKIIVVFTTHIPVPSMHNFQDIELKVCIFSYSKLANLHTTN